MNSTFAYLMMGCINIHIGSGLPEIRPWMQEAQRLETLLPWRAPRLALWQ